MPIAGLRTPPALASRRAFCHPLTGTLIAIRRPGSAAAVRRTLAAMPSVEHDQIMAAMRAEQEAQAGQPPPTVAEQRASYELIADFWPVPDDASITPVEVAGRPAEWVAAPGARSDRTVLYLHGGGYVIGSLATHRDLATRVSRASASRALLLDYRLAPEHPFPAALEDAMAAYRWLLLNGHDPRRLALAGDSAGGGLTLATLVGLRDAGGSLPSAAVCLSPWADLALLGESMESRANDDPAVDRMTLQRWADQYLAGIDPRQPLASPLYADLSGLPPLLLLVGTAEVLLDDAARVAQKATAAGVEVVYEQWPDLGHVFPAYANTPEAAEAAALIETFLDKHLI